ncbi:MAG TPA: hypothetical protein PLE59_01055 [Bacteroidales bacterium]|jgi:hypothetical protein|nr:hypothetical protein [Bacteroidales bacterium]HOF06426.1 hypothetical protein [Bacteroidales bacterium]HON96678.1 hypothetical protein [Bacteroidales bacterium]HOS19620.1 hypothetical protein [Bacteroidales bacterium]HOV55508.1 hypothetical protein [Bacteroidales bacterium]
MRQILKIILFSLFLFSITAYSQSIKENYLGFGAYAGEGTGVFIDFKISPKVNIEWDFAYHELFYKYDYLKKYNNASLLHLDYNNIFSTSILINHKGEISNNKLYYYLAIGPQIRIIPKHTTFFNENISLPPNLIIIDDPETNSYFEIGLNPLVGILYKFNNNLSIFGNIGTYTEIAETSSGNFKFYTKDVFLWTNFQFRIGISYYLDKKIKSE